MNSSATLPPSASDSVFSITSAATASINSVYAAAKSQINALPAPSTSLVPSINSVASDSASSIAAAASSQISVVSQDAFGSSTTTPSTSATDTATSSSTSSTASSKVKSVSSAATTTGIVATTTSSSLQSTTPTPSKHRLPNGTVAGIVVGAAIGLALLTCLATYLLLRRKYNGRFERQRKVQPTQKVVESAPEQNRKDNPEPKLPFITESSSTSPSVENYLPQSADDQTIRTRAQTVLDQIELHVENFYQDVRQPRARLSDIDLDFFSSLYLPNPLGTLLHQSKDSKYLIKHALAQFIGSKISLFERSEWSLLPDDFLIAPKATPKDGPGKPG